MEKLLWFFLCLVFCSGVRSKSLTQDSSKEDEDIVRPCGLNMECVPRYMCTDNGTIIRDGRAIIDMRQLSSRTENHECNWQEKCCSNGQKKSKWKPSENYVSRGCGYSNPKGLEVTLENTVKGESQFGEFPWMISVWETQCQNNKCSDTVQGGGSLLAPNVVLTTAHKILHISAENLMVRAGEWDTLTTAEPLLHKDRDVAEKIVHPNFDKDTGFNDVALLILKKPFKLAPNIDTICLPGKFDNFSQRRCFVMGWGKKQTDDPDYPHLLKKIDVPFVDRARCQAQLRRTRLSRYFELHSSFVCAGGEKDKDACLGDGGSPLVCPSPADPNRYVVAGIVSWGLECGIENVPGVYANVQMLRPWIEEQLQGYHVVPYSYDP
ncbi:hypothetical protein ACLKA6_014071 [Drosophila palustris]